MLAPAAAAADVFPVAPAAAAGVAAWVARIGIFAVPRGGGGAPAVPRRAALVPPVRDKQQIYTIRHEGAAKEYSVKWVTGWGPKEGGGLMGAWRWRRGGLEPRREQWWAGMENMQEGAWQRRR